MKTSANDIKSLMEYLQECFFAFNLIIGQNRDFLAVDVETQ
jgi:hypothetical protein